ncbi:unnamed protein product [Caenorhabditis brenneri]
MLNLPLHSVFLLFPRMVQFGQTRMKHMKKSFLNEAVLDEIFKRVQAVFHIVGHYGIVATIIKRGLALSNGSSGLNCAKAFALDDKSFWGFHQYSPCLNWQSWPMTILSVPRELEI